MRNFGLRAGLTLCAWMAAALACSEGIGWAQELPAKVWPGPQPDGSVLLPNQWSLRPVGRHVELGDFPVNIAVHPDGKFAAVLHCGYSAHQIIVVDLGAAEVVARKEVPEAFYGLAFDRQGKRLWCSGAGAECVHQFAFDSRTGLLSDHHRIRLREENFRGAPAGLAVDPAGKMLFAANL
jgi:DNA-binding beta-propeller fold protein YncE